MRSLDSRLERVDAVRTRVKNDLGVETTLFANELVPVESAAVSELLGVLQLQRSVEQIAEHEPGFFDVEPALRRVVVPSW